MWAWAPEPLKTAVYDSLAETLAAAAEEAGLDPERAFPKPKQKADEQPPPPARADGDPETTRAAG
jgi:hypothetical protein